MKKFHFHVVVTFNGKPVLLSIHPTLKAAQAAADASPYVDARVLVRPN